MTEIQARAGEVMPRAPHQAAEVTTAMADFVHELKNFQGDVTHALQQQEERLNMLNKKTVTYGRPALSTTAEVEAPHQKAFDAYVRSGDEDALRGLPLEGKALNTSVSADGGYLVDPQTSALIRSSMASTASLRAIANVVQVTAGAYDVLIDKSEIGSGWANETSALTETTTPKIDRIHIPLHELTALPKASQRLLDDSAFDIEEWLADRIASKFARSEAAAFISGNGMDKPKGFLAHTKVADASWEWGKLGYLATGAAGDFASTNPSDAMVDLVYALEADYRANATFVMNSKTAGAVRKMKDGDGRFLWSDGLAAGESARLMGYPVLICEDMPDIGANAYAIAFGDFSAAYTVAERPDMRVLRDPFSAKPHVLFYASKRVGGDVSDFRALKLLKFAAS